MRIGVLKLGGIGDCVDLYVLACAIRRKHPDSTITCYVTSETGAQILQRPVVDVVRITYKPWHQTLEEEAWKFDLFYDLRPYVGAIWRGDYYRKQAHIVHLKPKYERAYEKMLSPETNKLATYGMDVIALHSDAVDLDASYDKIEPIWTPPLDELPEIFRKGRYVTVHIGADKLLERRTNTKMWYPDRMGELAGMIRELGYEVIQLGVPGEPEIENAVQVFDLDILSVATVLKHAVLHIDVEGGLVRLRRLMTKKPSVVLFGPTPVELFGFKENVNICANVCHPCFWMEHDWMTRCIHGWNRACMQAITVEDVWERTEPLLRRRWRSFWL